jgi:CheY-like chemotaxis protein
MTFLIVDDISVNRILLEKIIRTHWTFQTLFAEDGVDALEKIKANRPDLILLDIQMPQMDGKEFLQRFREQEEDRPVPVIVTTVVSDSNLVKELAALGVSGYLLRPFSAEQVLSCVSKAMGGAFTEGPQTH